MQTLAPSSRSRGEPMDDNNAALNGVFSAARTMLVLFGTALAAHGMATSGLYFWVQFLAGSIMVIGPGIWGFYVAVTNALKTRQKVAQAVGAGINLVVAGKALASDGSVIGLLGAGASSTPPLPVTMASAQKIVKDFAPTEPAK